MKTLNALRARKVTPPSPSWILPYLRSFFFFCQQQTRLIAVAAAFGTIPISANASDPTSWPNSYIPSEHGLPNEAGWSIRQNVGEPSVNVTEEGLVIDTRAPGDQRIEFEQQEGWSGQDGAEILASVRVVEPLEPRKSSTALLVVTPAGRQVVAVGHDFLSAGGQIASINPGELQEIRVKVRISPKTGQGELDIWTAEDRKPVLTVPLERADDATPKIGFGDLSATEGVGGLVEWKFLSWNSEGESDED